MQTHRHTHVGMTLYDVILGSHESWQQNQEGITGGTRIYIHCHKRISLLINFLSTCFLIFNLRFSLAWTCIHPSFALLFICVCVCVVFLLLDWLNMYLELHGPLSPLFLLINWWETKLPFHSCPICPPRSYHHPP